MLVLFTFPVTILGRYAGLSFGCLLSVCFLSFLFFGSTQKISKKLNLEPLSVGESPEIHHAVKEFSRRLGLTPPKVTILRTPALNIGAFGLNKNRSTLIVTEGLLKTLSRAELTALIGRALCAIGYGDTLLVTWFSRFLAVLEPFSFSSNDRKSSHRNHFYSLQWVLRQMVILPLALIPQYLLLNIRRSVNLDLKSINLTRLPKDLSESYRLLEAMLPRIACRVPFGTSPLFLTATTPADPLSQLLFSETYKAKRVAYFSRLVTVS